MALPLSVTLLACGAAPPVPDPLGPDRTVVSGVASLRYPSAWSAQLDPTGGLTLGPDRCGVEVIRVGPGSPDAAAADGLARAHADYGNDPTFARSTADVQVREGTWLERPAVVATTRARTARWPWGDVLEVEAAVVPSTRTADGVLAVVSTCVGRGQLDLLHPGLAVVAASLAPRSGPMPPVQSDHVALAWPPGGGWAVSIAAEREELYAYTVGGPICAARVGWSAKDPSETLVVERMREAFVADAPGDWSTTQVAGLDGQRWTAETTDGTVAHRSDVRAAAFGGGAVYVVTTAAEYDPCDPWFERLLDGFSLVRQR